MIYCLSLVFKLFCFGESLLKTLLELKIFILSLGKNGNLVKGLALYQSPLYIR